MNFLDYVEINPKISFNKGEIYPFIDMESVSTNYRAPSQIRYKEFSSGVKFQDGDTVIARITPCLQNGKRFYCKGIGSGFGSTEYLVFRPKKDDVDNLYLYYYMKTEFIKQCMINSMIGATGRQRVNNSVFKDIEINFPDIEIQRKIGLILSAYDDLIENNQRQIKLLEETAQRLYKEWFVDLHFPGRENTTIIDDVPEGWSLCSMEDVIEFDPKVKLTKDRLKESVPMSALSTTSMILNRAEFTETYSNSGSKFQNGDTLLARITPCLENGKTAFVSGIESEEGAVGSTEYIVMRSKKINSYMVYLIARSDEFRNYAINSMSGSDGRQRVKADKLKGLNYLCPSSHLIDRFGEVAEPIFNKIFVLNKQCEMAQEARDRLLPKLMGGELEL